MATLTVGIGKEYSTIAAAVAATQDGDTVLVQAGTYTNDFATITHKITLQSVGGQATLVATVAPPNGKAILTTDTDAVIDGFGFTGAAVADANGAGIRYEGGNLTVNNSVFWDNQEGILGAAIPNGNVVIENSEFSHNGDGSGFTHNIYIGAVNSLLVEGSYFHDAVIGHEIKSRALNTTIIGNRIEDNLGNGSYSIDLPNGGNAIIQGNLIEKGVNAENYTTIAFGEEGASAGSKLAITGNTIVNDNANGFLVNNAAGVGAVTLSGNQLAGFASDHITSGGSIIQTGNTTLATKPVLDLNSLAPVVLPTPPGPPPPPPPTSPPPGTLDHAVNFGPGGAVIASGHVLTVGTIAQGGQFASLAAALTASADGDTIKVAAGTYINDFGTVNHKVIIEGVGGIAHFVSQNTLNAPQGMLVVNADATIENLDFSGADNYGGHEGGIFINAGNVTITNSSFEHNDIGIWTADNSATTLSVFSSDIGSNGSIDKQTNNFQIGAIGSFTLKNSYVHDALIAHELYDRAWNSDIEQNRIIDGPGSYASFALDLGVGGNDLVQNNVFEKGADAANGVLINVGGEGGSYTNSNVKIAGNTLISDLNNPGHPYTYFINGHAGDLASAATDASNNTFVGGVAGSAQLIDIAGTNEHTALTHPTLDTSSPVSAALAPAMYAAPTIGPNILGLELSETKQYLDAQFIVAVDGVTIGGGIVTADTATQAPQTFGFNGWWGAGPHTITITGTNVTDATGPESHDIVVAGVTLDTASAPAQHDLLAWNPVDTLTLAGDNRLPDFDAAYYLAHNPDVAAAGVDPLAHYLAYGWKEGRNPDAWFDDRYYLEHNPDVAAAGVNPLQHYEAFGWKEGRNPDAWFDNNRYEAANPNAAASQWDPLLTFINNGDTPAQIASQVAYEQPEAALFDAAYYLLHNPDVAAAHVDPLVHYEQFGWHEGRNPSASFSTNAYLNTYADIKAAGIDPLAHYAEYGMREGRQEFSV